MPATYSGDPANSATDALRFALGDTDLRAPLFEDAELAYLLSQAGGAQGVAEVLALERLAVRFSRQADESLGDLRVSLSQLAAAYAQRAKDARLSAAAVALAAPYAGGISRADVQLVQGDTDRVRPAFAVGRDDYARGQARSDEED